MRTGTGQERRSWGLIAVEVRGVLEDERPETSQAICPSRLVAAMGQLALDGILVVLDHRNATAPEQWARRCRERAGASAKVLAFWAERLGRQARPPSALPFRWLARKYDLRPGECLLVAGSETSATGARRAGWEVLSDSARRLAAGIDLDVLIDQHQAGVDR